MGGGEVWGLSNGRGKYWCAAPFFDLPQRESFFY
jgi:hypothetical protein